MRQLGKALLDDHDREGAKNVLDRIEMLDPNAFKHNQECAALKGRYYVDSGNYAKAIAAYSDARDANSSSYYLVELLAQAHLRAGQRAEAEREYDAAVKIIQNLGEHNIWTHATTASAAIVAGREQDALTALRRIREFEPAPSRDNLETVEKGLTLLKETLAFSEASFNGWRQALYS